MSTEIDDDLMEQENSNERAKFNLRRCRYHEHAVSRMS